MLFKSRLIKIFSKIIVLMQRLSVTELKEFLTIEAMLGIFILMKTLGTFRILLGLLLTAQELIA